MVLRPKPPTSWRGPAGPLDADPSAALFYAIFDAFVYLLIGGQAPAFWVVQTPLRSYGPAPPSGSFDFLSAYPSRPAAWLPSREGRCRNFRCRICRWFGLRTEVSGCPTIAFGAPSYIRPPLRGRRRRREGGEPTKRRPFPSGKVAQAGKARLGRKGWNREQKTRSGRRTRLGGKRVRDGGPVWAHEHRGIGLYMCWQF